MCEDAHTLCYMQSKCLASSLTSQPHGARSQHSNCHESAHGTAHTIMSPPSEPDQVKRERKREQNRIAQRNYRDSSPPLYLAGPGARCICTNQDIMYQEAIRRRGYESSRLPLAFRFSARLLLFHPTRPCQNQPRATMNRPTWRRHASPCQTRIWWPTTCPSWTPSSRCATTWAGSMARR